MIASQKLIAFSSFLGYQCKTPLLNILLMFFSEITQHTSTRVMAVVTYYTKNKIKHILRRTTKSRPLSNNEQAIKFAS